MKPTASHSLACRFGIFIIAFHDSIPANDDFTNGLTILWNIVSFFIDNRTRLNFSQADVRRAYRGDSPYKDPAVGVKHRQSPKIAIRQRHRVMKECADYVDVGVAVRDHHSLRL